MQRVRSRATAAPARAPSARLDGRGREEEGQAQREDAGEETAEAARHRQELAGYHRAHAAEQCGGEGQDFEIVRNISQTFGKTFRAGKN